MDEDNALESKYDACKNLIRLYHGRKDTDKFTYYTLIFFQTQDSLDIGKRQEMASTVNNLYQYNRDRDRERQMEEEVENKRLTIIIISLCVLLLLTLAVALYLYMYQSHMKTTSRFRKKIESLEEVKERQDEEMGFMKNQMHEKDNEIDKLRGENEEKLRMLTDRNEYDRALNKMIDKAGLEQNARDILDKFVKAANGGKGLTAAEWIQLVKAVDMVHPSFRSVLNKKMGKIGETSLKICYLKKVGLSLSQIMALTNMSKSTVWRWMCKFNEAGL